MKTSIWTVNLDDELTKHLREYLLGKVQDTTSEQFDELSITDDLFNLYLNVVENDLVDAYVRNELKGDVLRHFLQHYLSTHRRREKVRMALMLDMAKRNKMRFS